jgi:hypothetical protein
MAVPADSVFLHGFLQVDVPMNGNAIDYADSDVGTGTLGKLTEQPLLHLDYAAGCWLYRNPDACALAGLAALAEFHYTTTLADADVITSTFPTGRDVQFGNPLNRVDVTNVTVGLHGEVYGRTNLRIAAVFPLQAAPERPFDAEFQVSLNRGF